MGFERCHPAVNFIYFVAVIAGMVGFIHPIFLAISFLCAFAYSVKRNGGKALFFNLLLLPFVAAFALYYSSYHHFGVTVIRQNFIGNRMTVEALVYGFVLGFVVAGRAKPMTLLKGNELNSAKEKNLDLVLRRKSGESKFAEILIGDGERLAEHKDALSDLLSQKLLSLIPTDERVEK